MGGNILEDLERRCASASAIVAGAMQGGSIDVPVAQAGAARCDAVPLPGTPQTDAAPPLGGVAVVAAVPPKSVTGAVDGGSIDVVAAQAGAARRAVPLPDAPQTAAAPPGGAGMSTNGAHPPASVAGAVITAKIGDAPQHDIGDLPDDTPLGQLVPSLLSRSAVAEFEGAFQWQKGDVLQVSDDSAPFRLWGFWGRVDLVKGDIVFLLGVQSNKIERVERWWLRRLSPPPEDPASGTKNVNWIQSEMLVHMASAEWLPVPLPAETVTLATLLAESEIAAGCLEIGWRLRTKGVVVVPPVRGTFAAQHCLNNDALNDHGEGAALVDQLLAYAARANLLLVPLLSDGHWVLLAVQRSGSTGKACWKCGEPSVCYAAAGVKGCSKFDFNDNGCSNCDPAKNFANVERIADEWGFVDPLTRVEPLPASDSWEVRYWDSLDAPHRASSNLARACLDGLQAAGVRVGPVGRGPASLLPRCNKLTQGATNMCGWYTLYAVEEEIRRFRGESAFSIAPNFKHRLTRLTTFVEKLRGCAPPVPP